MYKLILFIECIYVIYMLVFFKTKYSFHLPIEKIIQNNISIYNFIKHPINTGIYQNKVCFLGHLFAYFLILWNLLRISYNKKIKIYNIFLWLSVIIISLIMNPNVTLYLLPIFILEIVLNICKR